LTVDERDDRRAQIAAARLDGLVGGGLQLCSLIDDGLLGRGLGHQGFLGCATAADKTALL
jgi:hypothetical protein